MESGFRNVELKDSPSLPLGKEGLGRITFEKFCRALFPHHFAACEKEGEVLCKECFEDLKSPHKGLFACATCGVATPLGVACDSRRCQAAPLDGLLSVTSYSDRTFRRLLHLWKYERVDAAGAALAELFKLFVRRHRTLINIIAEDAEIIPVPLAFVRRAIRGFNQSEALASIMGKVIEKRVSTHFLRRYHGRAAQAAIEDRQARKENITGLFYTTSHVRSGGRYVLVDDVATSSATLQECAKVLKKFGAKSVWGVTLLRG